MITVRTRYYAYLREITGVREEEIALEEDTTIGELLGILSQKHGEKFRNQVLDNDFKLKPGIAVALNGEKLTDEPLRKRLRDGDTVVILPPISGGANAEVSSTPQGP